MTRTTSSPEPFCFTAAIGTVSAFGSSSSDDLDRHRRAVGRAEVADLRSCPRRPAAARRPVRRLERREVVVELRRSCPAPRSSPPASVTVTCWPTFSFVRSDADACSVTVKFGSVSDSSGVPGGTRIAFLHEHLADADRPLRRRSCRWAGTRRPSGSSAASTVTDVWPAVQDRGAEQRLEVLARAARCRRPGS